jgi:hypothetical protein
MNRARILIVGLVIALLVIGIAACGKDSPANGSGGATSERKEQAKVDDEVAREELAEPNHAEAREWLRDPSHILFEGSREHVIALVDQFYHAGAPKVYVTGIDRLMDSDVTATIVVELPAEKGARKKVFDAEASWQKDAGEDPALDVGQKYLRILLD